LRCSLKASAAEKAELQPAVDALLSLKAEYQRLTGEPFDAPKANAKPPKAKAPQQQQQQPQVRSCRAGAWTRATVLVAYSSDRQRSAMRPRYTAPYRTTRPADARPLTVALHVYGRVALRLGHACTRAQWRVAAAGCMSRLKLVQQKGGKQSQAKGTESDKITPRDVVRPQNVQCISFDLSNNHCL
jgi:WHEP-TRS domain